MSEKRIGVIAEGKCDFPIIEGAVKAVFSGCRFVFTHIQPSDADLLGITKNESGLGWGGVYYACKNLTQRIELQCAAGTEFDMIIIHIDGDVMHADYKEAGIENHQQDLPCYCKDSSLEDNCGRLENIVANWLGGKVPDNTALCIPHINTDVWAAFILFPDKRNTITEMLSKNELESQLLSMPAKVRIMRMKSGGKIKKDIEKYYLASNLLNEELWDNLCNDFTQARRFSERVKYICIEGNDAVDCQ